jgi:hypothetical protein
MGLRTPHRRVCIEPLRRFAQVDRADDIVPFEDGASVVRGQLHRDALGHARPHQVAPGGPRETVLSR